MVAAHWKAPHPMADKQDQFNDEEAVRRMNAALKRALNTPHEPHQTKASRVAKAKAARPASAASRRGSSDA